MLDSPATAARAADAVLLLHAAFITFVVFGQVYVLAGWMFRWPSARNRWFRRIHLGAIGIVVVQAWIGMTCPLTSLESGLRIEAGAGGYEQGFVAHWLTRLIYHDLPHSTFVIAYSVFAALVLLTYWQFPPLTARARAGTAGTRC